MLVRSAAAIGLVLGATVGFACHDGAPTHCADADGDATCAAHHADGTRPYCVRAGCAPELRDGCSSTPPDPSCYVPCGAQACGASSSGDLPTSTSDGGVDTTATPASTTMNTSGSGSSVDSGSSSTTGGCEPCSADAPICEGGACIACADAAEPDAACAAIDPDRPLCGPTGCVQCNAEDTSHCTGTVPVCDVASGACIGCTAHEQCPLSACLFGEGSCMPPAQLWYVDGDADCGLADGSLAAPYCTIAAALANIGQAQRGTLRIAGLGGPYVESSEIDANRVVAILPTTDDPVVVTGTSAPTFAVDGATLLMQGIRLQGNGQAPAISASAAGIVWLRRMEIVLNQGGGISIVEDSDLHVDDSVIGAGGTGLADRQALYAEGSTFDVVYTTIAGNDGTGNASIRCVTSVGSVRNSIVIGLDPPSISCVGLVVDNSAVDTGGLGGAGNMQFDAFVGGWFLDPAGGDFRIVGGTVLEGIATWEAGDPLHDLEGADRPGVDGAVDVAGADLP